MKISKRTCLISWCLVGISWLLMAYGITCDVSAGHRHRISIVKNDGTLDRKTLWSERDDPGQYLLKKLDRLLRTQERYIRLGQMSQGSYSLAWLLTSIAFLIYVRDLRKREKLPGG